MMFSAKMKPVLNLIAIIALLAIGFMISVQGFHHHHYQQDQYACKWHNIVPASFILTAMLAVFLTDGNTARSVAVPARIQTVWRLFLTPDLLNLPPPIDR